jgi:hypothetical protein
VPLREHYDLLPVMFCGSDKPNIFKTFPFSTSP